jgi:hypothetical protein
LARGCYASYAGRPCRFSRLRRSAPTDSMQVCCTLQPVMGFTTLQARSWRFLAVSRCRVTTGDRRSLAIPVALLPFEAFPSTSALSASPQPIPSRRYHRCRLSIEACCHVPVGRFHAAARPQGVVPLSSPLLRPGVATWKRLVAPLGFVPPGSFVRLMSLLGPKSALGRSP